MHEFTLTAEAIDTDALQQQVSNPGAGAVVSFTGRVRNHNRDKTVLRLEYEAHEALAVQEGRRILSEAADQFDLIHCLCVHRIGALAVGDAAVCVVVSAAHRDAAFNACRAILDRVKKHVPIWKNEHWDDGQSGWIEADHDGL